MKDLIIQWNPWWVNKKVSPTKKGITRQEPMDEIRRLLNTREVLLLTGARRSGKSTLLYQSISHLIENGTSPENILYFNFDEPLKDSSTNILEKIYNTFVEYKNPKGRKYLFFDELQNIKGWEKWVKKYYDLKGKDIKFIVTGSNSSILSRKLGKLLTGRIMVLNIFPLSFQEYLSFKNIPVKDISLQEREIKHHFQKYLLEGGFPEVVLEPEEEVKQKRLSEYFDSIVLRDIVYSGEVRETGKLRELADYAMTNISSLFSYNKISKAIGLNINSVKEYLHLLEEAHLLFQVKFFSYSVKESIQIQQPRKIYAVDNGLRNAVSFKFSKDEGRLAENLVFLELRRRGRQPYYWKDKKEVDFIIKNKDQSLTAINVSYTDEINKRELESLKEIKKKYKNVNRRVLLTRNIEKTENGIEYVPLFKWVLNKSKMKNCF